MRREEVILRLSEQRESLGAFAVKSIAVFGSVARGTATEDSDVDVLVEFDRPTGLFAFVRFQHWLEDVLGGVKVDLTTPGALRDEFRAEILKEAIRAA